MYVETCNKNFIWAWKLAIFSEYLVMSLLLFKWMIGPGIYIEKFVPDADAFILVVKIIWKSENEFTPQMHMWVS